MTKKNDNSILIISNDITIINTINFFFNKIKTTLFENRIDISSFSLIILDDYSLSKDLLEKIIAKRKVVNISSSIYKNIINVKRPFFLKDLLYIIEKNLISEEYLQFKDFSIINNILQYKNVELIFGNKEIDIIKFIFKNNKATRIELLKNIWNCSAEIETKVVENTINNIRQKFKSINIDNFLIYENKKYLINKEYK